MQVALTSKVPGSTCPFCGKLLDAATGTAASPRPGDVSLCVGCGAISMFGEGLLLRQPSETELETIRRDRLLMHVQAQLMNKIHGFG